MSTRNGAIRWTVQRASVEFGIHRETLAKHLRRESVHPGSDQKYSTSDICKGVFGDLRREQTRESKERADKLALDNAERRKELIPAGDVFCLLEGSFISIRERILGSSLSETEQTDLLKQLYTLRDADLCKLGREALLAEFQAKAR